MSLGLTGREDGRLLEKPIGDTFRLSLSLLVREGGENMGLGLGANSLSLWPFGSKPATSTAVNEAKSGARSERR